MELLQNWFKKLPSLRKAKHFFYQQAPKRQNGNRGQHFSAFAFET